MGTAQKDVKEKLLDAIQGLHMGYKRLPKLNPGHFQIKPYIY